MQTPTARMLATLPDLAEHIVTLIGGLRQRPTGPAGTAWEAPIPVNADAFDDANRLWVELAQTTADIARVTGSTLPGPAAHAWRDQVGTPLGLPSGITPADVRYMVSILARWIEAQLPYLGDPEAMLTPLEETYGGIRARYPLRDRPRTSRDALCPDDRGALAIKPPRHHGDEQLIVCQVCGRTYSQDEHERLAVRFAAVEAYERAKASSLKVAAGLIRKYGTAVNA